jgi:hypothetical protein
MIPRDCVSISINSKNLKWQKYLILLVNYKFNELDDIEFLKSPILLPRKNCIITLYVDMPCCNYCQKCCDLCVNRSQI